MEVRKTEKGCLLRQEDPRVGTVTYIKSLVR